MGKKTRLHAATTKPEFLRTTVPVFILRQFNLEVGDMLDWELKAKGKDEFEVVVRPVKKETKG